MLKCMKNRLMKQLIRYAVWFWSGSRELWVIPKNALNSKLDS